MSEHKWEMGQMVFVYYLGDLTGSGIIDHITSSGRVLVRGAYFNPDGRRRGNQWETIEPVTQTRFFNYAISFRRAQARRSFREINERDLTTDQLERILDITEEK
jgi:hypothetical protein